MNTAAALALTPTADWRYAFTFRSTTTDNLAGAWINQRNELIVGGLYAAPGPSGKTIEAVTYEDPLNGEGDAALVGVIEEFIDGVQYAPQTVIGSPGVQLILAESSVANNDIPEFTARINAVRALESMAPYNPATAPITPVEVLIHTRLVNVLPAAHAPARRPVPFRYRRRRVGPLVGSGNDAPARTMRAACCEVSIDGSVLRHLAAAAVQE